MKISAGSFPLFLATSVFPFHAGAVKTPRTLETLFDLTSVDFFDLDQQQHAVQFIKSQSETQSLIFNRGGKLASFCKADEDCDSGLSCVSRKCFPGADSCLAKATTNFASGFDANAWKHTVFAQADLTEAEVETAATNAGGYNNFKRGQIFNRLVAAVAAAIPTKEVQALQAALDACNGDKQGSGPTVYNGIHLEVSGLVDIAMDVFWTVQNETTPSRGFIRGTFGVEAGAGAETSYLLGIAFTDTPGDLEGGGIVTDFDLGLVATAGTAVVAGVNGKSALEFTFGLGGGFGVVGVGYSISSALEPTTAPTSNPVPAPAPAPGPSGGGGGSGIVCPPPGSTPGIMPFTNIGDLKTAVGNDADWIDPDSTLSTDRGYPIGAWDVSQVTDFGSLFAQYRGPANADLSCWNTASVANMYYMFERATSFNGDVSGWNTASVTDMRYVFQEATSFNGDVSGWNTASVTNMRKMFPGATSFNGDVSGWNTALVESMRYMFRNAASFNGDLSGWNVFSVTDFRYMFQDASAFNQDISNWSPSDGAGLKYMFNGAASYGFGFCNWYIGNDNSPRALTGVLDGTTCTTAGSSTFPDLCPCNNPTNWRRGDTDTDCTTVCTNAGLGTVTGGCNDGVQNTVDKDAVIAIASYLGVSCDAFSAVSSGEIPAFDPLNKVCSHSPMTASTCTDSMPAIQNFCCCSDDDTECPIA